MFGQFATVCTGHMTKQTSDPDSHQNSAPGGISHHVIWLSFDSITVFGLFGFSTDAKQK
jgi:hypothetical protein